MNLGRWEKLWASLHSGSELLEAKDVYHITLVAETSFFDGARQILERFWHR